MKRRTARSTQISSCTSSPRTRKSERTEKELKNTMTLIFPFDVLKEIDQTVDRQGLDGDFAVLQGEGVKGCLVEGKKSPYRANMETSQRD